MSLRYRLFLWVSGLFVVLASCSFLLENYISHRQLEIAQQNLRAKILAMSDERRIDLQSYLARSIAENQLRIDAILNNISSYSTQAIRFAPTTSNARKGTWGDAADLLLEYSWIDFLQNTNEGKTTAAMIPEQDAMNSAYRVDIDEDLSWVYLSAASGDLVPYLSVRIPYSLIAASHATSTTEVLEQVHGVVPFAYLLFDPAAMKNAPENAPVFTSSPEHPLAPIPVRWTEGFELDTAPFAQSFQRARELLLTKKIQPPQQSQETIKAKMEAAAATQDGKLVPIPTETLLSSLESQTKLKQKLEEVALRYTQINVIWVLMAMYESGMFGSDLFHFPSPAAITVFTRDSPVGIGLESKNVFFSKKLFDDAAYYKEHASQDIHSNLGTSLAIIPAPTGNHVFLGNTAKFNVLSLEQEKTGYLTLGMDADSVLERLVLAIRQTAVLVHEGKALNAYDENGQRIPEAKRQELPVAQMLQETSGLLNWDHSSYFYMKVQPFENVDLYFFLFNPEEKEFALLRELESGSERIISSILLYIHVAGLFALLFALLVINSISRRITKPIAQLAIATESVAEGRLDEVELSLPPLKHDDEIAVLCHSFEKMVTGLREKEKVKGVLNKVVSREIAQEILKGNVHLGGEEKKVTVLFADIRDFTKMTQDMPPHEVIDLLNVCMTKISLVIDENGGVIDKYVGDEAMALFGAPIAGNEDAYHAIVSALEMMEVLKKWNGERALRSLMPIELGIGIHTGEMLAGNMGAENRLNYTVIGSNVNLGSRLCGAAKRMEILITKDTLEEPFVKERILYEEMPAVLFKGFDKEVTVYLVQGLK